MNKISNFALIMKKIVAIIVILTAWINVYAQNSSHNQLSKGSDKTTYVTDTISALSYAWQVLPPLGLREPSTIDTLLYNYYQKSVPSEVTPAYATTGNLGSEGQSMIFFQRPEMSEFFFTDALQTWIPGIRTHKFYNTRRPMTLLSYNTGGGKETTQDRLKMEFSANANEKTQIGAYLDYLYSKGSYNYQATKDLIWGASGSYIGDRYELQTFFYHYNLLNKENGGITDDLYITDPAEIQGGSSKIDTKTIPTNLTGAHSKFVGTDLYINNRYKVGYYKEEVVNDSVVSRTYIPVSSFIWTLNYKDGKHIFKNKIPGQDKSFWENTYLSNVGTDDRTSYWSLTNTLGISLLEGFNKYAKAGLAAYATHKIRKYTQTTDTIDRVNPLPDGLSQYPVNKVPHNATENLLWVGAQLTKQQGTLLKYEATAQFGLAGSAIGDVEVNGNASTKFKLLGDSVTITAYGRFSNQEAPYLMNHYVSNHFIWENDFGKVRRFRIGGKLNIPHTNTYLNIGVENLQNYIYFNEKCLPTQHSGSVQVLNASLNQNFKLGILHFDNKLTYQTSSDESVIPLPKFSIYSNLYLLFKVAGVLDVQFGVDCDYYTRYKSVGYQPATMSFYNQTEVEVGNYPFMNAYANMKLDKARFYIMFSHVNQGMTGNNYFALPHYPLNPRKFQIGVSVDFAN